jgi:hypothetical protein
LKNDNSSNFKRYEKDVEFGLPQTWSGGPVSLDPGDAYIPYANSDIQTSQENYGTYDDRSTNTNQELATNATSDQDNESASSENVDFTSQDIKLEVQCEKIGDV